MVSKGRTARRCLLPISIILAPVIAPVLAVPPASAATSVVVDARIDGRPAAEGTERRPIQLHPDRPAVLELRLTNTGAELVELRTVRLAGEVMGLSFFTYDTSISVPVVPGATESRTFPIDLAGLDDQAVGLMQGSVGVLDAERETVGSQRLVVDVRGSLWSVYGAFGIAVVILTVFSFGGALLALSRHRLPNERWRRGLRFLTPGLGIGLFVVFTLSALRIFVPRPGRSVFIVLVCGAVLFGLGYLTPGPEDEDDEDDEENVDESTRPRGSHEEQTARG